jgi:hypothetical protein
MQDVRRRRHSGGFPANAPSSDRRPFEPGIRVPCTRVHGKVAMGHRIAVLSFHQREKVFDTAPNAPPDNLNVSVAGTSGRRP